MRILIKNALVLDPQENLEEELDVFIEEGIIRRVSRRLDYPHARIIDGEGLWAISSVTDAHVHLREPGYEYKETIETGLRAALKGGITRVMCMANTDPVNDDPSITRFILEKARTLGLSKVFPVGAVTKGLKGEELSPMMLLRRAGCVAFSDDGRPVSNPLVMRRALEYAKAFSGVIITHCEIEELKGEGVVNEGFFSTKTGFPPIPPESEVICLERDLILAEYTGSKLHVAHVSLGRSVEMIKGAKGRGIDVSCETCPHYFLLSEERIDPKDASFKVNPPIRTEEDRVSIEKGIEEGVIDMVSSDHAPHAFEEKFTDFINASFGISGIETLLPLTLSLYHKGIISRLRFASLIAMGPSRRFGLGYEGFREGAAADITLIDPQEEWTIDPRKFVSKGKHTPFKGWRVKGKVKYTIVDGEVRYPFDEE